ncbi:MAG: ABC transporter ATP-binding protein [Myxococcota bacterium]
MLENFGAVWRLMRDSALDYALAILAMVIASIFLFTAPLIPQAVIDGVLVPTDNPGPLVRLPVAWLGGADYVREHLWVAAVAYIALTAVAGLATYLRLRWAALASEGIVQRLRDELYDHLQRLTANALDDNPSGDLIQRCTSDVETIRVFFSSQITEIARSLVMFLVPIPMMLLVDVRMTGLSMVLLPIIVGFSSVFFLRVGKVFEVADEAEGELTTAVQENLTGIRVVRAFGRQDHEETRFGEKNQAYRKADLALYRLFATFWSVSDWLTFTQTALVLGGGIALVWQGELAVGALYYFLTVVGMFMYPMRQMGRILSDLGKAMVALKRIRVVLDAPTERPIEREQPLVGAQGGIVFDNVTFRYQPELEPAISGLSLTIAPKSTVAFVGPSGAGKSTLVSLLMRLYDPSEGTIELDGIDLTTLERTELRRRLAVVLQEPFLFSKSLRNNLRLGRADATDAEVEQAARIAHIHSTIEGFDQGYDTVVGERGVTLSGGQRQRTSLARGLLQDPAVLILDDTLSAVDTETETAILAKLRERRGVQTTILIAHRLSTVALADHIFVLDEGRLVQSGTHAELLAQGGPYADLWALQTEQADASNANREAS